jgi:tyrosinase
MSLRLTREDIMRNFDRRSLLQGGAAVALTTAASATDAFAQRIKASNLVLRATPVLRRSVNTMALDDPILVSYRKAIAAMQALPSSDPRNWIKQADIHKNFCPHRNWYFLPWHRAYLVAFERICRQLSGNASFALPYWDWTANGQLPAAFATPNYNGQPNPLYDATRTSQTVTVPATYVGASRMSTIYAETSFEVFGSSRPNGQNSTAPSWLRVGGLEGPLEGYPHDYTHGYVGGDMGQVSLSPRDPILWLHHCNIDRVWDHWNNMGRANTGDSLWRTFAFNGQFVNPSGASGTTPYNTTVTGVLDILSLRYRYTLPLFNFVNAAILAKEINLARPQLSIKLAMNTSAKLNVATVARALLSAPQTLAINNLALSLNKVNTTATAAKPMRAPGRVLAILRDIDAPATGNADVRVFVNYPEANADTSVGDRHYAGSFTFFGGDHAGHNDKFAHLLDITQVVNDLNLAGVDLAKEISLHLVPVPLPGVAAAAEVNVGSIEIAIF